MTTDYQETGICVKYIITLMTNTDEQTLIGLFNELGLAQLPAKLAAQNERLELLIDLVKRHDERTYSILVRELKAINERLGEYTVASKDKLAPIKDLMEALKASLKEREKPGRVARHPAKGRKRRAA